MHTHIHTCAHTHTQSHTCIHTRPLARTHPRRQRYKKAPSFFTLHMGVKAELFAARNGREEEKDCHHIILEDWKKWVVCLGEMKSTQAVCRTNNGPVPPRGGIQGGGRKPQIPLVIFSAFAGWRRRMTCCSCLWPSHQTPIFRAVPTPVCLHICCAGPLASTRDNSMAYKLQGGGGAHCDVCVPFCLDSALVSLTTNIRMLVLCLRFTGWRRRTACCSCP